MMRSTSICLMRTERVILSQFMKFQPARSPVPLAHSDRIFRVQVLVTMEENEIDVKTFKYF